MASLVVDAFKQVGQLHKADDDLVDRLNHRFTVILLVVFTAFVSTKQFVGDPISCWCPSQFSGQQVAYTNSICWIKGTYFLETKRELIPHRTQNSEFRIAYYQFVPYILLVMALFFYLPHMLWRNLSRQLDFDLRLIIQQIQKGVERDIHQVASQIHITLEYNSSKDVFKRRKFWHYLLKILPHSNSSRNRLCLLYIFIKFLYIINCLCQFLFLSFVLSFPFHTFGYDWFRMTFSKIHNEKINNQPDETKWFPRVVMCEFMVRQLGSNQHWMVVQCNLPINLFNELIFLIIWAWFICLTCLTCLSLFVSLYSIYTNHGYDTIRQYFPKVLSNDRKGKYKPFFDECLKWDGILILRIISQNTNDAIMSSLVHELFQIYSDSRKKDFHIHQEQSNIEYATTDNTPI